MPLSNRVKQTYIPTL